MWSSKNFGKHGFKPAATVIGPFDSSVKCFSCGEKQRYL